MKRYHDDWRGFVSPFDLVDLWDELSPSERSAKFEVPTLGLAKMDPLEMLEDAFAAASGVIEKTSPDAAAT